MMSLFLHSLHLFHVVYRHARFRLRNVRKSRSVANLTGEFEDYRVRLVYFNFYFLIRVQTIDCIAPRYTKKVICLSLFIL